jgi:hypothetical protein
VAAVLPWVMGARSRTDSGITKHPYSDHFNSPRATPSAGLEASESSETSEGLTMNIATL